MVTIDDQTTDICTDDCSGLFIKINKGRNNAVDMGELYNNSVLTMVDST